jgi:hypothetical protein
VPPVSVIDRNDLQEALDQIDVLDVDQAVPYGRMLKIVEHILDMAGGEGRDLTVWEKANLHRAIGALAANQLAFAWVDLNEALADPADVEPYAVTTNETAHLTEITAEALRRWSRIVNASGRGSKVPRLRTAAYKSGCRVSGLGGSLSRGRRL